MAHYHRPYRAQPKVMPNTACQRGMDAVKAALEADAIGLSSDALLAMREQAWREADAAQHRQGELILRGSD